MSNSISLWNVSVWPDAPFKRFFSLVDLPIVELKPDDKGGVSTQAVVSGKVIPAGSCIFTLGENIPEAMLWHNVTLVYAVPVFLFTDDGYEIHLVDTVTWLSCPLYIALNRRVTTQKGFYEAFKGDADWDYLCQLSGTGEQLELDVSLLNLRQRAIYELWETQGKFLIPF